MPDAPECRAGLTVAAMDVDMVVGGESPVTPHQLHHAVSASIADDSSAMATSTGRDSSMTDVEPPANSDTRAVDTVVGNEQPESKLRGIETLPNEILHHIFNQCNVPPPSDSTLYDEPHFDLTSSEITSLKSCSSVCRKWRRLIIPILYRHTRLIVPDPDIPENILRNDHLPMLDFIRRHDLKNFIATFTLCVAYVDLDHTQYTDAHHRDNNFVDFWETVFDMMDPLEVKIVASPQVLGALTNCHVDSTDYYQFNIPYQVLHLRRLAVPLPPSPPIPADENFEESEEPRKDRVPLRSSTLFEIRPWHSLLFHEGSFIKSYDMYDFHEKEPPTILDDLIGNNAEGVHTAMLPLTIREFSYIAIFPNSNHFHKMTRCCPRLDKLYVQFVPRGRQLEDAQEFGALDPNDMWLERNSCYAYIMRELFNSPPLGNYRHLKEFESGDAADVDAWEMAVEYVKRAGGGWRVERPGVFVKDTQTVAKDAQVVEALDPQEAREPVPSLFQGQLQKWAFAGVEALPVSSLSMYFRPQSWNGEQ